MNSRIYAKHSAEFKHLQQNLLSALTINQTSDLDGNDIDIIIDGRNLACPMPLLKVKFALKALSDGAKIYLITSNIDSNHDISAFCQKNHHAIIQLNTQHLDTQYLDTQHLEENNSHTQSPLSSDTFFHFIIVKNTSV